VTDFDSFAHACAKWRGIPLVSLDHQHVLTRCRHPAAVRAHLPRGFALTKAVIRAKLPRCDFYIASSFYRPPVLAKHAADTRVIGPILRPEVLALEPERGRHVVVYQTSHAVRGLGAVLAGAPAVPFVVYGLGMDERRGNVTYRSFDERRFLDDLATARAVITNGGHTVMAEALYLGKPLLSVPVRHQGEQEMNAAYLVALGHGHAARELDGASLERFLSLSEAAPDAPRRVPAGNGALGKCLAEAFEVAEARS
jgi:uncharacterized protein (TIGR00661 family)